MSGPRLRENPAPRSVGEFTGIPGGQILRTALAAALLSGCGESSNDSSVVDVSEAHSRPAPAAQGVQARGPASPARVILVLQLAGGASGLRPSLGPADAAAAVGGTAWPIRDGEKFSEIEMERNYFRALGNQTSFLLPGWLEQTLSIPAPDAKGRALVTDPITLTRATAALHLARTPGGCDYTTVELVWKMPLHDEPAATPPGEPLRRALTADSVLAWDGIPTGIYSLVLKGGDPRRVADFILDPELAIASSSHGGGGIVSRALPPSLSGCYITYVPTRELAGGSAAMASFYGVRLDIAKGSGEVMAALSPVGEGREITVQQLKPRPDTLWPLSNLVLREAARVEFDCPLFFVDYHLTLETADAMITLKGEFIPPEDQRSQAELLSRMRLLRQRQIEMAATNAGLYEPGSVSRDYQRLPFFSVLATPEVFGEHLRDRSHHVHSSLDMGRSVIMSRGTSGNWEARLMRAPTGGGKAR